MLKIASDLFEGAESGCVIVLVALNLSAAFDTINHLVLVRRLEHTFGVKRPALSWAKSYLEGRSCFVKVGNAISTTLSSDTGVPQGSVLGPWLIPLFTTALGDVISSFGVKFHQYADESTWQQTKIVYQKAQYMNGYSTTLWLSTHTSQKWLCSVLSRESVS